MVFGSIGGEENINCFLGRGFDAGRVVFVVGARVYAGPHGFQRVSRSYRLTAGYVLECADRIRSSFARRLSARSTSIS